MDERPGTHTPVTSDSRAHIGSPFYHGTKSPLEVGAEIVPGYGCNFQDGRVSNNIYFTALVERGGHERPWCTTARKRWRGASTPYRALTQVPDLRYAQAFPERVNPPGPLLYPNAGGYSAATTDH
jgi:hypothetical protein